MKYLTTAALIAFGAPVFAQSNCASTKDVQEIMGGIYGEEKYASALSGRGYLVEVWANNETGTWTIIATSPEGISCVMDQGEGFAREELPGQL